MTSSAPLRWGDQWPAGVREARERILDGAEACLAREGYSRVTMEAVAAEAKISRATLYRYFSNRDEVFSGVVLREFDRYLERIRFRVESQPDLGSAILEFVRVTLRAAGRDRTITGLFTGDEGHQAGGVLAESSVALFEMVTEFFRPMFASHPTEVRAGTTVEDAAEWILRTVMSLGTVTGPRRRSGSALDTYLSRYLLPAIVTPSTATELG